MDINSNIMTVNTDLISPGDVIFNLKLYNEE